MPPYRISAWRFREARLQVGMGVVACAELLRVHERTIRGWESGATRIPYAAYKLLRVLKGGRYLAHPIWRDFVVQGDTLITPEGHRLQAGELSWWSLLVRQARAFRSVLQERSARVESASADRPDRTATESPVLEPPVCGASNTAHLYQVGSEKPAAPQLSKAQRGALTPKERVVLQAWEGGADLRSTLPKATFYRHRRVLLACGVDIKADPLSPVPAAGGAA